MQGNLLVANVIGDQGILRYKIEDRGSSFAGVEQEPVVMSTDPNFRPSDLKVGPDGAIWFIDWQNPIIGHMQHNLRDPSRDREHGRIYRVTYEGRDLLKPVKMAGEPIEKVLNAFKEPEDRVHYRARIELGAATRRSHSGGEEVDRRAGCRTRTTSTTCSKGCGLIRTRTWWMLPCCSVCCPRRTSARAPARVLCYWRDRVPDSLELFKPAADALASAWSSPRASFFTVPEAWKSC
jgi:hypothetical protein